MLRLTIDDQLVEIPKGYTLLQAVRDSVPKGTEDLNLKAFEHGYAYGQTMLQVPSFPETLL